MNQESLTDAAPALRPVAGNERIAALDVVRGFALIGIFLMNIEFFNRPTAQIGSGLPATLSGADWWAGYFVYTFVQGKFWTMFSLLFGMGFAVMLTRAERAGRGFLGPYLRRIAALALFGAAHHILLWSGDILFSYAVGAICLLLLLWARWWLLLLIPLAAIGAAAAGFEWAGSIAFGVGFMAIAAIFLRSEARIGSAERGLPWLSLVFLLIGFVALGAAALAGNGPVPVEARWPSAILGSFSVLVGMLSWRFKDPREARPRRLGATMYLTPFIMMFAFGVLMVYGPKQPVPSEAQVAAATVEVQAERAARDAGKPAAKPDPKAKPKTPVEKAALSEAQRRVQFARQQEKAAKETRLLTGPVVRGTGACAGAGAPQEGARRVRFRHPDRGHVPARLLVRAHRHHGAPGRTPAAVPPHGRDRHPARRWPGHPGHADQHPPEPRPRRGSVPDGDGIDDDGEPAGLPGLRRPRRRDAAQRRSLQQSLRARSARTHGADQLPDALAAVQLPVLRLWPGLVRHAARHAGAASCSW